MTPPPSANLKIETPSGAALTGGKLILLASLAALGALATNIMLPAFPDMARALDVTPRDLAWTLSSFFIVFAVGQLFIGPLSDAMGRAPFVIGGLVVFVIGSIVCAFAPSLPVLIAGRGIQAAGACAASVLARAIARDLYEGPELTRALSLVMIAMAAAPGFSPALGTAMTLALGWRSTFVFVAVAGVAIAVHYVMSARETLPRERRRSASPVATTRAYADLAFDARFIFPALAVSLVIGCLYSFFGAAPAILMTQMGFSATGLSVFFAATVLVVFGSGLLAAPLARRWGAQAIGITGILIAETGALWLLIGPAAPTPVPFMAAITLFLAWHGPHQSGGHRPRAAAPRRPRRHCLRTARLFANDVRSLWHGPDGCAAGRTGDRVHMGLVRLACFWRQARSCRCFGADPDALHRRVHGRKAAGLFLKAGLAPANAARRPRIDVGHKNKALERTLRTFSDRSGMPEKKQMVPGAELR